MLKKSLLQAAQKDPDARRNHRDRARENVVRIPNEHEHVATNTNSSEAIERQRSRWVFFSSLLVSCPRSSLAKSGEASKDFISGFGPDKRFRVLVS